MNNHASARSAIALLSGIFLIALSLTVIAITPAAAQTRSIASTPTANTASTICFVDHNTVACVNRPALAAPATITAEVQSLTQWLIAGPTSSEQAQGAASSLPSGTQLDQVSVIDNRVTIDLILPDAALKALTDQQVEDINEQFRTTFTPYNFQRIQINARGTLDRGSRLLSDFLPPIVLPKKGGQAAQSTVNQPEVIGSGGLHNKTVFISAGHGWYWNTSFLTYRTQRPVYPNSPYPSGEGIIEDFNNAEAVNQYLLPYLQNAGADAWTVRERDMNTNMIIVDDGSAGFSTQGVWASNSGGYNGTYRSATTVNAAANTTATWAFTPSVTATYAVYVRFPSVAITRTVDAHFFVEHAGATTPITITQARDGNNWRFIGNYPFYGGQATHISVNNQSATPGVTVLADAVRIGGGVGDTSVQDITTGTMPPPSGKPRWEEQSRQYAKWVGMPNVDTTNDVIVRPIYSEWEKEAGEDAVYISWHTNGYNGYNTTTRGTTSYIYLTPTPNSALLQSSIHSELLNEIHTGWDGSWPDLGQNQMDLGEVRLLSTMPGVLIENGFHDNPTDVEAMKDPRFLQLSARAIYHGLVNYWHAIDPNVPLIYLPEPPQKVMMRNSGAGQITIAWQPGPTDGSGPLGDLATSYRVYTSTDGFGWSNPIDVATTSYTFSGLLPNQLIYAKVAGVNAGGESFASPVLAARAAAMGQARMLIVYGFDRIDRSGDTQQNDPPEGSSRRVFIDRINRFDAIIQHAEVITLPFDSAQQAVVSSGSIGLGSYTIVDWIAGENVAPSFPALTSNDQSALTNFLNNGGALFISGSNIGYEWQGTPFYANTLRASYVADAAQVYAANATASGIFNGLGTINFDDGTHGMYNVDSADVFAPVNGAASALVYNTASAALQYANGCTHLVYSGIPFETIYPRATRQSMMTRLINYLGACLPAETQITSPLDGAFVNTVPAFTGTADANATQVQVSIRRESDSTFYNGSSFVAQPEIWLTATNVNPWSYSLPPLIDGAYALRARAMVNGSIGDLTPAAITFTLDTVPPAVPTLITPTNGISLTAVAPVFQWTGGGNPAGFYLQVDGITTTLNSPALSATKVVTDGDHVWRVRAFDAAGNRSNWSAAGAFRTTSLKAFLPIMMMNYQAPVLPVCYDAIVNGGFESGDFTGWTRPSQNPPGAIVTDTVFSGNYAARIGAATIADSITTTSYSSVKQSVSIPANAITATLSLARYRWSGDTANDYQYLAVLQGSQVLGYLFSGVANDIGWNSISSDLKSYAGQAIELLFSVMNDGTGGTSGMALDEIHVQICVPQ